MALEYDANWLQPLTYLIGPLWGKPRVASLLATYLRQVDALEVAAFDVLSRYTLDGADDARLAVLGRVVGQFNAGWDTETYRAVLRGKIRANRSRGLVEDLIEVIQAVTPTDDFVHEYIFGNATMAIWSDAPVSDDVAEALAFLLPKTRAAGVQLHFFWAEGGSDEAFIWDENPWDDLDHVYWSETIL